MRLRGSGKRFIFLRGPSVGPTLNKMQKRRSSAVFLFVLGIVGALEAWQSLSRLRLVEVNW